MNRWAFLFRPAGRDWHVGNYILCLELCQRSGPEVLGKVEIYRAAQPGFPAACALAGVEERRHKYSHNLFGPCKICHPERGLQSESRDPYNQKVLGDHCGIHNLPLSS